MTSLAELDIQLFHLINQTLQMDWLDMMIPYWRSKYFWGWLYVFIFFLLVLNYGKKGWLVVLTLLITIGITDVISSQLLKKTIKRERPCKQEKIKDQVNLLVKCGSGYSFPSSHAANHFAMAAMFILLFGKRFGWIRWPLFLWALSIAFGQVYVGVHFPSDVFFGAITGSLISWFIYRIIHKIYPQLLTFAENFEEP